MTCIAAKIVGRGQRLRVHWAWESRTSLGDGGLFVAETVPKVIAIDGWGMVGGAGDSGAIARMLSLFSGTTDLGCVLGRVQGLGLTRKQAVELLLWRDGLCLIDHAGALTRPALPYFAIGMAWQLAMGAMAAGASAERAVRIACALHASCGEPVHAQEWTP